MPHVPGMIADGEFLGDDWGDQGRSPHAGVQTLRHGAAVQDIPQMLPLGRSQLRGASTAMTFQESFIALPVPSPNPSVNAGAVHLQALGHFTGGLPLDAEHDGLQSQGDAGRLVRLGFLPKRFEPLEGSEIAARKGRLHGQIGRLFYFYAHHVITVPPCPASKKGTFHPPNRF
jgi:hypothetical protein